MKDFLKKYLKNGFPFGLLMYRLLGNRLFVLYFLSLLVGALDALGITFIVPLLKMADESATSAQKDAASGNAFIVGDVMRALHIPLNMRSVVLLIIVIFVCKGILKFFLSNMRGALRAEFTRKLREKIIVDFLKYNYRDYININIGRIINALTQETMNVSTAFIYYNNAIISIFSIISYLYIAVYANFIFTILAVLSGGLISLVMRKLTSRTKKISTTLSESNAEFSSILIQSVNNFKYLKTTGSFSKLEVKLRQSISYLQSQLTSLGFNQAIAISIREPFSVIIIMGIIVFQTTVLDAKVATILVALFIFWRALTEIINYQSNWQNFISTHGAYTSVTELMAEFAAKKEVPASNIAPTLKESISLEHVGFAFSDSRQTIDDVSISIRKNTSVAFVGESGSGKTTLVDIITGLLKPQSGRVLIDSVELNTTDIFKWRDKIGFISQDNVVFNDTIINNISLWDDSSSTAEEQLEKARSAARKAHSEDFIDKLDHGFETQIGDRGVKLSGGQKQRLAIARELYKEVELLILDEATSALDSESESIIKNNIDLMKGQFTMIIIAHRLSTIKNVDYIYVMNDGKIVEEGSYEQLLNNQSSKFSRMVKMQEL